MNHTADPRGVSRGHFSLDFPYALSPPPFAMGFRTTAADFRVVENLGFSPEGEGEHLYLQVRKTDENTRWVAHLLADHFGIDERSVGYCGLKDRRAITTQWFSVHLPGAGEAELPQWPGVEILDAARHGRKLRPGMHADNGFEILLRGQDGARQALEPRLAAVAERGVPNYFGEQRFGRDGNNLEEVAKIVASRHPRFKGRRGGLYLSAARAWLFNQVLAERVATRRWLEVAEGPLWGRGRPLVSDAQAAEEQAILAPWAAWCLALEHSGLKQECRPLLLKPEDLRWQWRGDDLQLAFTLPPGTYATALLRELAELHAPAPGDEGASRG